MAPTPSSKSVHSQATPSKTPQSKHRTQINFGKATHPSPNPNFTTKENPPAEHPVEVIGRIRDYPDRKEKPISALQISADNQSVRVRTDIGYRDFSLDGVSLSEEEDLDEFYKRFVESRINDVKLGAKCTIMMYGPTGSGKSHTMFGCPKQPGIVYRAMRDILGEKDEEKNTDSHCLGVSSFVQVTVLEIYNEEIYDLLSNNTGGGLSFGWPKGNTSKVRLEVMGKKAKNAAFIFGNEAGKISKEVAKVEKRRIVKSTQCNERSSRSHCMIILDVPSVGGRLMLVDMAGSENIDQAGQIGFEAKMQTAKINQGNIALKRVVESIANGDSHVPFRDSKLTMLLQDSFEDDKSKILMILCASPDPKEIHKTISTLEYGAKAKCIVRGPHTPTKDKIGEHSSSEVVLGSRIAAMDQFIFKLQMENKLREKEHNEAQKELLRKEEEVAALRAKLELMEGSRPIACEEEINLKVNERTHILKIEIEKKLLECQKAANEFVELGRRRMEEKILQQQEEVEMLKRRLEEIESELCQLKDTNIEGSSLRETDGSSFAKRLLQIYTDGDRGMEISMELDMGDKQPIIIHEVKDIDEGVRQTENFGNHALLNSLCLATKEDEEDEDRVIAPNFTEKVCLSTVFEEEEEDVEKKMEDEEVEKEIVEETALHVGRTDGSMGPCLTQNFGQTPNSYCNKLEKKADYNRDRSEKSLGLGLTGEMEDANDAASASMGPCLTQNFGQTPNSYCNKLEKKADYNRDRSEKSLGLGLTGEMEDANDAASARRTRIQNIFLLCGNHRELAQHVNIPTPAKKRTEATDVQSSPVKMLDESSTKSVFKEISPLQTVPMAELGLHSRILSNLTAKNTTGTPNSSLMIEPFTSLKFANEQKLIEPRLSKSRVSSEIAQESKENSRPEDKNTSGLIEVYVKWEASKENPGKFVTKLKVVKDSSLADLRKLIETHLGNENSKQAFTFLMLRDPTGAPVVKEKEATLEASELPICNNHLSGHLACLRPVKATQWPNHLPFSSLENKLQIVSNSPLVCKKNLDGFSPKVGQNLSPAPHGFIC